jgi:DNA-binding CsgD family transcriptional regulator
MSQSSHQGGGWTSTTTVVPIGKRNISADCPADRPVQPAGLSSREAEILALIVQGLSNEEIAERMFLSINTVKSYIRSAYRKAAVNTRAQALLWGVDNGFRSVSFRTVGPARAPRPTGGDSREPARNL